MLLKNANMLVGKGFSEKFIQGGIVHEISVRDAAGREHIVIRAQNKVIKKIAKHAKTSNKKRWDVVSVSSDDDTVVDDEQVLEQRRAEALAARSRFLNAMGRLGLGADIDSEQLLDDLMQSPVDVD